MKSISRLAIASAIFSCIGTAGIAQVSNSLYFMHGVPQSNRINPAFQPKCGFYLGFPAAAPLRMEISSSSLSYSNIIFPHPTQDSLITFMYSEENKQAFLNALKPVNFVSSNLGTSLASLGFRTGAGFFSLDVTTRVDGSFYYPGDIFRFMLYGAGEGETYTFDGIGTDLAVLNEISLGWSAGILDNLHVGARAKMLFGIANFSTTRSALDLYTSQDEWIIRSDMMFNASLPFAEIIYDEDGFVEDFLLNEELENPDPFDIPGYIFNAGNLGFGVDVGASYRPIEQLQLSASVLDLAFIRWNDGVNDVSYNTEYSFKGLEINPFEFSEEYTFGDYLDSTLTQMGDSLLQFLQFTPGRAYSKRLNTKLYLGASFYVTPGINFGLLSRTDFLPQRIAQQVTASANFTTGRFINLTLSYSYMNSYLKNIGAGLAFNVGPLNLYLISDNALNLVFWPYEARSANLWFGMNLVFGYKQFKHPEFRDRPLVY